MITLILSDFLSYIWTHKLYEPAVWSQWWHDGDFSQIVSFTNMAKLFNKSCSISLTCINFTLNCKQVLNCPFVTWALSKLNQEQHVFIPSWCNFCRHQTRSIPVFTCPIMVLDLNVNVVEHVVHPRFIKQGLQMNKH